MILEETKTTITREGTDQEIADAQGIVTIAARAETEILALGTMSLVIRTVG